MRASSRNDSPLSPDQRGAKRIVAALEDTLNRLGTDYVDLYQQHTPDPDTPMEEVLEAMDRLVRDGKVREIGCCNYTGALIDQARSVSDERNLSHFVSSQSRYNLLQMPRQEGVLEACQRHGMALLPYFPLASGLLTGKYRAGEDPADGRLAAETAIGKGLKSSLLTEGRLQTVHELERFAQERGHTILELAISWLTSQPVVGSVIAGATRPEQVAANAAAANLGLVGRRVPGRGGHCQLDAGASEERSQGGLVGGTRRQPLNEARRSDRTRPPARRGDPPRWPALC